MANPELAALLKSFKGGTLVEYLGEGSTKEWGRSKIKNVAIQNGSVEFQLEGIVHAPPEEYGKWNVRREGHVVYVDVPFVGSYAIAPKDIKIPERETELALPRIR